MLCIDYGPNGTNTDVQQVILNNNSNNELGSIRQNLVKIVIRMFLITIQTWKISPRLPTMRKLKRKWQIWRLDVRAFIPWENVI